MVSMMGGHGKWGWGGGGVVAFSLFSERYDRMY